ncbi:hypothetical protein CK203_052487 [Vitis vinifera]|uniref:Uncharacterized protein n=1 Tax=Vitis vinifera TaxID=29760 RepID=A0A438HCE9_VITVI|nr:hypothetical protein CK203_052487 [Vitis vinifera]
MLLDSGGTRRGRTFFRSENVWLKEKGFLKQVKTWTSYMEGRGHVTDWLLGYKGEEFYSLLKREMLGGVLWKSMVSGFDGGNLLEVEVQGFVVKGEG